MLVQKNTVVPEGIEAIHDYDFGHNYVTESIYLSSTVSSVDLSTCYRLKDIQVDEDNPYFKSIDGVLYSKDGQELIKYPQGKEDEVYEMPEGVKKIADQAISNVPALKVFKSSDSLETIGNKAFFASNNLAEVSISPNVKTIMPDALAETSIAEDSKNWYKNALYVDNCLIISKKPEYSDYGNFEIKDGTRLIADKALCYDDRDPSSYLISGDELKIPESVKNIGKDALYNQHLLGKIVIRGEIDDVGYGAFQNAAPLYVSSEETRQRIEASNPGPYTPVTEYSPMLGELYLGDDVFNASDFDHDEYEYLQKRGFYPDHESGDSGDGWGHGYDDGEEIL
jgi:hypothetical protein